MKVKRIMSNTATLEIKKAKAFYGDILGLELLMDHGWFQTYGSDATMTVQVSFGSEGGSGTRTFSLDQATDAHRALNEHYLGNLALKPS